MQRTALTLILLAASAHVATSEGPPMATGPGILRCAHNDVDASVKVGARPYEMEGRKEDRTPLFGFEDLAGWTVQCLDGADAELVRTREQQMWGEYVGKLTYTGKSADSRVTIRPPSPIRIPDEFDCINMWIHGNVWGWAPEPGTPQVDVAILLKDASGKEQSVYLTRVRWKEWWLAHKKLLPAMEGMSFSGIEVTGLSNAEQRSIFLDSIYFYREVLKPLKFAPRPARNLKLPEGQSPGLNTGPGRLPFPTREETILPTNFETDYKVLAASPSPGRFEFSYEGKDCKISYGYQPKTGDLGEITAYVNGKTVCLPMAGGGIEFGDDVLREGKLESASLNDGVLTTEFDLGGVKAIYRFRIWQKSLVIDFECRGGEATGVALGEIRGILTPRLVRIPYIKISGSDPRVLCSGDPYKPVFASVWVDWYRSNGSELWSDEWAHDTSAKINGGVRYIPRTDGKRNDLFERVFLTISPTFEETLPTIANPKTPLGKIAGERLWQESWGPGNYEKEHERSKMLRSYGIEKLTQCNHEITWRDGGESFTLRTKAAPGKGGDEALKRYVAQQRSLGWLSGLYTNYTDFAPVNKHWDEDLVQRTPEGEMRPAWPRCYALKPSRAVELDAKLAPAIQRKFGSNAAYTDVHTAVSPWAYADFDARVPGAGTLAATFYAYGELLLHDQKVYGPTWSEGTYQWLYAGLATGNYGLCYSSQDLSKEPLNVAFDLMKIHPLELDIGMPWTGGFFKEPGWDKPDKIDESIDHFIAATIAYGHIGWLVEESHGIERTCRSYYMLQQLQKRYALQKPVRIEYANTTAIGPDPMPVSWAISTGVIEPSKLHVVYANGLELWVNGSQSDWSHLEKTLPPWGWIARDKRYGLEEFSALIDGHRVDYVKSPEYEYLDGRGVPTTYGGLAASGSIAVRRFGGRTEITDIYGNDEIGIETESGVECEAYDAGGKSLGAVGARYAQKRMAWFKTIDGARTYVLTTTEQPKPGSGLSIRLDRDIAAPGQEFKAALDFRPHTSAQLSSAVFEVTGCEPVILSDWCRGVTREMFGQQKWVTVACPKSAKPGSRIWLRLCVSTEGSSEPPLETWHVLAVVEPFTIKVKKARTRGHFVVVYSNVSTALGYRPHMDAGLKSEGKSGLRLVWHDSALVTVEPVAEPREATDVLVVSASMEDLSATKEFQVRSGVDYPVVWQVENVEGFAWGRGLRSEKEMAGGGDSGASFQFENIACGGVVKHGIFAHPPWRGGVGYSWGISSPIYLRSGQDCEFRTLIGLKDGGDPSDGVVFSVLAIDQSGQEYPLIKEHWAKREWKEVSADLSQFKGKTIRLKFITDVGPNDNSTADWASWGEPRIMAKNPVARIEIDE